MENNYERVIKNLLTLFINIGNQKLGKCTFTKILQNANKDSHLP
jgi:hypothetical protein